MLPEDDNKKWGRIYMGGPREASLEQLDAMQAATRREQWNQRTQGEYLERVRERATERARGILGEAYQERQKILDEAREEAGRIVEEARQQRRNVDNLLARAETIKTEAAAVRAEADRLHAEARSEGYEAGLAQAGDELDAFRGAMGESVAALLAALQQQCAQIFDAWREELVELFRVCVEKGTGWVLDDQHAAVLESLVMEAVRQLEDRRAVHLRVHPDDEAAVADMFAAARERMPGLGQWVVTGDPSIALGGLIVEGKGGTVDSRLELHRELVDTVLGQLTLPPGSAEQAAGQVLRDVVRAESDNIARIAPPVPYPGESPDVPEVPDDADVAVPPTQAPGAPEAAFADDETALPDSVGRPPLAPEPDDAAAAPQAAEPGVEASLVESPISSVAAHMSHSTEDADGVDTMLQELEQELLPIPPAETEMQPTPAPVNPPHVDAVLAEGGFLTGAREEVDPASSPSLPIR